MLGSISGKVNKSLKLRIKEVKEKKKLKLEKTSNESNSKINNWDIKTSGSISENSFELEKSREEIKKNEQSFSPNIEVSFDNQGGCSGKNLSNILQKKNKKDFTKNPNYKTEICKNFELYGKCEWMKNCCFAHGKHELREKSNFNSNYKTKICKNYHFKGFCLYGSRCQYYHFKSNNTFSELLNSFKNQDFDFFEKSKQIDLLCDASGHQLRQRLDVFKTIFNPNL
jgi:hypothetical protein